jgi:hypothetical protein
MAIRTHNLIPALKFQNQLKLSPHVLFLQQGIVMSVASTARKAEYNKKEFVWKKWMKDEEMNKKVKKCQKFAKQNK